MCAFYVVHLKQRIHHLWVSGLMGIEDVFGGRRFKKNAQLSSLFLSDDQHNSMTLTTNTDRTHYPRGDIKCRFKIQGSGKENAEDESARAFPPVD
jgi:hypothetical protein